MTHRHDVIVAGLGAMGSLTLYELAIRGYCVLGFDRHAPPHALGSSHGKSRIIREAYFEDPRYVPLVQRAYKKWAALEEKSSATLFRRTGGLMLGPPDGMLVHGALRSASEHRLPHEVLSSDDVRRRFPAFHPNANMIGVLEPRAGILNPELAIEMALQVAKSHGADVRVNEAMIAWEPDGEGVIVTTTLGRYYAKALVLTVGAWTGDMVRELGLPLVVQRNVQLWYSPARNAAHFTPERLPVFISEYAPNAAWYGFPDTGDGLKVARHHHGVTVDPSTADRTIAEREVEEMRALIQRYLPDADGQLRGSAACFYTNTPDEHFVIDRHPAHPAVLVASPCSGHGFKFASAIGEALADLATGKMPAADLSSFTIARFAGHHVNRQID